MFTIKFEKQNKNDRDFGMSGILSRYWKSIFLFFYFFEIDIQWYNKKHSPKDSYSLFIFPPDK